MLVPLHGNLWLVKTGMDLLATLKAWTNHLPRELCMRQSCIFVYFELSC